MSNLRVKKSDENKQFWRTNIESKLDSIYSAINDVDHYPSKNEILLIDQDPPSDWNLIHSFSQCEHQIHDSFLEQKVVLNLNVQNIKNE